MKLMITGHRPDKLGGYGMDSATVAHVEKELRKIVSALDPATDTAISGMAQGADQLFVKICFEFGIRVSAYIPFTGQDSRWPKKAQDEYRALLRRCETVTTCTPHASKDAFNLRNALMIRAADAAIAVWDGSRGGTGNTVSMLRLADVPCEIIQTRT